MKYKFTENRNYSDYAAGKVILARRNMTGFPVRLASEIFQQCMSYLPADLTHYRLYDPCSGSGYLQTVLGFLHGDVISQIVVSDIDARMVKLAYSNLLLLQESGLALREKNLRRLYKKYNKSSHREALESLARLKEQLPKEIKVGAFVADALETNLTSWAVDVLISDLPYGNRAAWQYGKSNSENASKMLSANVSVMAEDSVLAIISDKSQRISHQAYSRLKQFTIGKRRITLLRPKV